MTRARGVICVAFVKMLLWCLVSKISQDFTGVTSLKPPFLMGFDFKPHLNSRSCTNFNLKPNLEILMVRSGLQLGTYQRRGNSPNR